MKPKSKTVAIVNAYNETAGPFTVLTTFLNYCDDTNTNFILFIPKGDRPLDFQKANVKVIYTKTLPLDKDIFSIKVFRYFFDCLIAFFSYRNFFRKYKIDILHNNSGNLFIQSLAARTSGVKIIYHLREVWNSRNKLSKLLYFFISRVSDKIICISNAVKEKNFSEKDCKRLASKIITVFDCIDAPAYQSLPFEKPSDKFIVTFLGRLAPIKGVDLLLEAFRTLHVPNTEVRLRIIGDIPKNNNHYRVYKRWLMKLVQQNGMAQEVEMLGFRDDVTVLLKESHLLVLPSRVEEGLGLVLIEGVISDNFIITSNLGGQKEIVERLGCGLLFENENVADLAQKMKIYFSNKDKYSATIATGKEVAISLFSPQTYCQSVVSIYANLIS